MSNSEVSIWPGKVKYGVGSVAALPELLAEYGCERAVVLCGDSAVRNGVFDTVRTALGAAYAGVISGIKAHTPLQDVHAAAQRLQEMNADALISVGGGSVSDAGKGIILHCASGGDLQEFAMRRAPGSPPRRAVPPSRVRHICVPTTAGSGSDVMPTAGVRDPVQGRKILFWDKALIPDATILDPQMAVHAGPLLTAASGMTAVARATEALYSKHRNPISTGLALHALRLMARSLPVCIERPTDLAARGECQMATVMASMASINAMASVVHAIGHVVGGKFGLQHGVAHAILLGPVARRFVSAIGADAPLALAALGDGEDGPGSSSDIGLRIQGALDALRSKLPLPLRLRDVGLVQSDIVDVVEGAFEEYMMQNAPESVSRHDLQEILEQAW